MAYTYHISFNNVDWSEFYPMSSNKITWVTEANEMFKRPKIDEIRIDGRRNPTIYATLKADFEDDTTFGDYVYYKIKRNGTDTFYFIASINDGKLDKQNDIYYITPRPNDSYEKILMQYDKKFQDRFPFAIISGAYNYPTLHVNSFINVDFSAFTDIGSSVSWSNAGSTTLYARHQLAASQPVGNIVYVVIKNLVNNVGGPGSRPQLTLTNVTGTVASNTVTLTGNGRYVLTSTNAVAAYVELKSLGSGAGDNGTFDYEIYRPVSKSQGMTLSDFFTNLLGVSYMNTGLTPKSTILWNDALPAVKPPNIDAYITANPTNDYVIQSAAIWNQIVLANADSLTTAKQTIHEISFKDIADILKTKMRIFWYIDSGGFVRFEHERYFADFASQIDVTALTTYKPEVDKKQYIYEKADIYNQILHKESNEANPDWIAYPVQYDLIKTTPNTVTVTPPSLSTDAKNIADNPGTADGSGYMLLQCASMAGVPLVEVTASVFTPADFYPNTYLSWSWLIKNYYKYFGDADSAGINGTDTLTLSGVKRFKKQVGIKFYYDGILNWLRPVTLAGGLGWIDKMELDLPTGFYTIDVGFDPYI